MKKTFILSDNSINRHGFRVMTDGIDLTNYKKNPIVLFMHMRSSAYEGVNLPIGKMTNIRTQGEQLLGDVEFDMEDDFAAKVAGKVERGILQAVSIGIQEISYTEDPAFMLAGQKYPTVTKCELYEVSVVDVPANANAVSMTEDNYVLHLGYGQPKDLDKIFTKTPTKKMELTLLTFELNKVPGTQLSAQATMAEVATKVAEVVSANLALKQEADTAKTKVLALETELTTLRTQGLADKAAALVDGAVAALKITADQKAHYLTLASKSEENYTVVKGLIDGMNGYQSVTDAIRNQGNGSAATEAEKALLNLSWDDAAKADKLTVIKNKFPDHYALLFEGKFGRKPKD